MMHLIHNDQTPLVTTGASIIDAREKQVEPIAHLFKRCCDRVFRANGGLVDHDRKQPNIPMTAECAQSSVHHGFTSGSLGN